MTKGALYHVIGLVVFTALPVCVVAAASPWSATATLDTPQANIGDPLRLSLRVDGDRAGARVMFPQSLEPLLGAQMQAVVIDSASTSWQQVYDVRLFDVGHLQIPALPVAVIVGGDTLHLQTLPLEVEVMPVLEAGDTELRQIKPPWVITGGIPVWIVVVAAVGIIALILFFVWRHRRRRTPSAVVVAPRAPTDYRREFSRIEAMGLLDRGALKLYYTHMADILRRFLEEIVGIDARERTSAEIAVDLRRIGTFDADLQSRLLQFLGAADLVKFARAQPTREEADQMPHSGRALVADVEAAQAPLAVAAPTPSPEEIAPAADAGRESGSGTQS